MTPAHDLSRRLVLGGGLALALAPGAVRAQPARLAFDVLRNDVRIGEHVMTFSGEPGAWQVRTEVAMTVRLGPVPVYRYRHQATERWAAGRFASLSTRTDGNGKRERVDASASADGVTIETGGGRTRAPAGAAPLTHWNPRVLTGPLFNPQTGKLLKVNARQVGPGHWALRGDAEIENFYDQAQVWRALKGKLEDGSRIEYRRV